MEIEQEVNDICTNPLTYAELNIRNKVVVLKSGMGETCILAQKMVGAEGYVVGVEQNEEYVKQAETNVKNMHLHNIHFIKADVDNIPVNYGVADKVLAQCAFSRKESLTQGCMEIFKMLAPFATCVISDVVAEVQPLTWAAHHFHTRREYVECMQDLGFENIEIREEQKVEFAGISQLKQHTFFKLVITAQKPQPCKGCSGCQ